MNALHIRRTDESAELRGIEEWKAGQSQLHYSMMFE